MEEKSIENDEITIEDVLRIEQEYILYLEHSIEEISELTGHSCEEIRKDLLITLPKSFKRLENCESEKKQIKKKQIKKKR